MTLPLGTTTTLDAVHEAIVATAREHFGTRIAQYGAYSPWDLVQDEAEDEIVTPALLLEVDDLTMADDDESRDPLGRLVVDAAFSLHCVLSIRTERLQQTLPQFAAAVSALVLPRMRGNLFSRGNLWGLGAAVEPPRRVQAQPAEFSPGLNGRDAWIVRWEQTLYLDDALPEL